jgi:hypothetical protein
MSNAELKAAVNYQNATQRDGCRNCKHREQRYVDRAPPWDRAWLACKLNDFATSAGAICSSYQADKTSAPPALTNAAIGDLFDTTQTPSD